jgi:hypothetical protein
MPRFGRSLPLADPDSGKRRDLERMKKNLAGRFVVAMACWVSLAPVPQYLMLPEL